MPHFHHPAPAMSRRPLPPKAVLPLLKMPTQTPVPPVGLGTRGVPVAPGSVPITPTVSPLARRIQEWEAHNPGGILPYRYAGGGPQPGIPEQQMAGFTLTAKASDAPDPVGQSFPPPAGRPPQIRTMLTAMTVEPSVKNVSWELDQNGLSADEASEMNTEVASAGLLSQGQRGQSASIIQSLTVSRNPHPKRIILRGVLRQSEDYEEALTFRTPTMGGGGTGQTRWQSQETPSGVKVSLPPQAVTAAGGPGSGGNDVLRLSFQIDPAQTPVALPKSPLFQKYHQSVLLRVGAITPHGGSYDYPFSDPQGVMSLYKQPGQVWQYGPSPDVLTLVVQQRVYIREIPFALSVPVSHRPFSQTP